MKNKVSPLKSLGQHFLKDQQIAKRIAGSLTDFSSLPVLEIGPGTGRLTAELLECGISELYCIEIDSRSVAYLHEHFDQLAGRVFQEDFLRSELDFLHGRSFRVIGNFPYNISSQILFRVLEMYDRVPELVGMFQKEVAVRIASGPGNRDYGILSVLLQAYYSIEYLFSVPPDAFDPPPKVDSGVIRMIRKENPGPACDPEKFRTVVKTAFNQRRKTLRNSLKSLLPAVTDQVPFMDKRPEQLSHEQFALLTNSIFK